jgi:hypothetical protein
VLRPREDLPGEFATFSEAWVEVVGEGQGRFEDCEGDRGPPLPPICGRIGKSLSRRQIRRAARRCRQDPSSSRGGAERLQSSVREIDKTGRSTPARKAREENVVHQKTLQFTEGKERTECVS